MKIPRLGTVMLFFLGLFQLVAGFATWIPAFVKDRVTHQFVHVWAFLLGAPGEHGGRAVHALAEVSRAIIGTAELAIGIALLVAAFWRSRRLPLTNFGLGLATALFGVFALTMFAMHDPDLPKWNQYPAMFAWFAATWIVVTMTEQAARGRETNVPKSGTARS